MRNATLLLTLSASLHLSAQNFPFPTSDATWVQYFEVMISPPPIPTWQLWSTSNFCMDGSDTLIAGITYTRLEQCNAGYVGGIRSVDESVYFFPADSTQEYMLYDFGAAVGDTIFDVYVDELLATGSEGWMGKRLVDVVVTAKAPSSAYGGRIVMQVQAIDPDIGLDSEWIEGIGCIHGLFTLNPLNVSQYWYGLECFNHNDTTFWNGSYTETPGTCAPINMSVDNNAKDALLVNVFPSPTSGIVNIASDFPLNGLLVRDALGRSVDLPNMRYGQGALQLDLGAQPSGLYLICNAEGRMLGRVMRE
jgi:hypothetical protein